MLNPKKEKQNKVKVNPCDENYEKLNCDISTVKKSEKEH